MIKNLKGQKKKKNHTLDLLGHVISSKNEKHRILAFSPYIFAEEYKQFFKMLGSYIDCHMKSIRKWVVVWKDRKWIECDNNRGVGEWQEHGIFEIK